MKFVAPIVLTALLLTLWVDIVHGITLQDVYQKLLERESGDGIRFSDMFIRPVAEVNGEFVWPRSYSKPGELFFDENGSAYNLRPVSPKMSELIHRSPLGRNQAYLKSLSN